MAFWDCVQKADPVSSSAKTLLAIRANAKRQRQREGVCLERMFTGSCTIHPIQHGADPRAQKRIRARPVHTEQGSSCGVRLICASLAQAIFVRSSRKLGFREITVWDACLTQQIGLRVFLSAHAEFRTLPCLHGVLFAMKPNFGSGLFGTTLPSLGIVVCSLLSISCPTGLHAQPAPDFTDGLCLSRGLQSTPHQEFCVRE